MQMHNIRFVFIHISQELLRCLLGGKTLGVPKSCSHSMESAILHGADFNYLTIARIIMEFMFAVSDDAVMSPAHCSIIQVCNNAPCSCDTTDGIDL